MNQEPLESRREVSEAVHETCRNFDALCTQADAGEELAEKIQEIEFKNLVTAEYREAWSEALAMAGDILAAKEARS